MPDPHPSPQVARIVQHMYQVLNDDLLPPDARRAEASQFFVSRREKLSVVDQRAILDQLADPSLLHLLDVPAATQQGAVTISAPASGVMVGVNLGRIIYGRDPIDNERRRLVRYLDRVKNVYGRLSLRGLSGHKDGVEDVDLSRVYIMLATTQTRVLVQGDYQHIAGYLENPPPIYRLYNERNELALQPLTPLLPEWALPNKAIVEIRPPQEYAVEIPSPSLKDRLLTFFGSAATGDPHADLKPSPYWQLYRSELVFDAINECQHLVLLGDPGSGKSVLLRYLAWQVARVGLDDTRGSNGNLCLPLFLPLRVLAGELATPTDAPVTVMTRLFEHYARSQLSSDAIADCVSEALMRGAAIILLDGLDEVPVQGTTYVAGRSVVLRTIAEFARVYPKVRVIVTCRVRAFEESTRKALRWPVRTLAPFTGGQIRHFLAHWYGEMMAAGLIDAPTRDRLASTILDAMAVHKPLREMATSPLLLTLMAQVVYSNNHLPSDRPELYEQMLDLLLGKWDKVNNGEDLSTVIGAGWDSKRIRRLLDHLSYLAHRDTTSSDGRGRLQKKDVSDQMQKYFREMGDGLIDPWQATGRCLDYIEQRSGLLVPDDNDDYVFAHLTFQEHCAGRYLLTHKDAAKLIMTHRREDRWHEPLMLGIGVVQEYNSALISVILRNLIEPDEGDPPQPKAMLRWYQDLVLAAEIGEDRNWVDLGIHGVDVARLQRDLCRGLAQVLGEPRQALMLEERVRGTLLLAQLGDVRIPITIEDWRRELQKAQRGDSSGYFCRVPAGTYATGNHQDMTKERRRHRYTLMQDVWMARYPLTNSQWLAFHDEHARAIHPLADGTRHPSQPVVGIDWYAARDSALWLGRQLGVTMRLPREYEWEAAARGVEAGFYPWGDLWHYDFALSNELERIPNVPWPPPIGCFPGGASPSGVQDMIGYVWQWCEDEWSQNPQFSNPVYEPHKRVVRGGSYLDSRRVLSCGWRDGTEPFESVFTPGVRYCIVLETT